MAESLKEQMKEIALHVDALMSEIIDYPDLPEKKTVDAMRYSALAGGKRLRPFLLVTCADMLGVSRENSLRVAAALEMIHCYSLIHDDLPAMDDDDLRRGVPTCHKQYDEATAILAGDALLTKAFEVLAAPETYPDAAIRCELIAKMANYAGYEGMIGGQMLDIQAAELPLLDIDDISRLQRMKTGRLIKYACEAAAMLAKADKGVYESLVFYAESIGLTFQIADDLLDVEGDAAAVGKAVGKDADAGKATFVSLLGADGAREKALQITEEAKEKLAIFGDKASILRDLADYIISRDS